MSSQAARTSPPKRRRDSDVAQEAPQATASSLPPSSLPPSSPPAPFTDNELDEEVAGEVQDASEGEGEDLFDENAMLDDYVANDRLDTYDAADLDEGEYDTMDADARARAEKKMQRRDRRERGERAEPGEVRRRNRAPAFLQSESDASDGDEALLARPRRRRMYDEMQDDNDDVADEVRSAHDAR